MAKRVIYEEKVSHERWMVSYADFLTLLLAFFVVMYSVSQLNEEKYRVLSDTLTEAFNVHERSLNPIQIGDPVKAVNPGMFEDVVESPESKPGLGDEELSETPTDDTGSITLEQQMPEEFEKISRTLEAEFTGLIEKGLLSVNGNEEWLEIELKSSLLFESAEAQLSVAGDEVVIEIAKILKDSELPIRVEGFTDDQPMSGARYPSNWELSGARAASVVKILAEEGVDPERMAAIGYGEHQPVASNATEAGRAANRRVTMMISRAADLRPSVARRLPEPEVVTDSAESETDLGDTEPAPVVEDPDASPVIRVQMEDGSVLFTNDPERARALRGETSAGADAAQGETE